MKILHNPLRVLLGFALLFTFQVTSAQRNVYAFKVKDGEGRNVSLKQYKGKVLLVVNTATACGFTPQYKALEDFYQRWHDKGFEVLDFPCNQFGAQAPGTLEEINAFCTSHYDTHFPRFDKVDVNGANASPLFVYLKAKQKFKGLGTSERAQRMDQRMRAADPEYDKNSDIKWNFTKFLIDRKGRVIARFEPTTSMDEVALAIQEAVEQ